VDAALRAVAAGLLVRAPDSPSGLAMLGDAPILLTPRELDVLSLIGEGYSNKAAARRLGISQHTVKFHLEAVFAKLGVRTRAEAVAKGLRRGLVEL
jgi:DNA-binding CsgD family transcriptional regulator